MFYITHFSTQFITVMSLLYMVKNYFFKRLSRSKTLTIRQNYGANSQFKIIERFILNAHG